MNPLIPLSVPQLAGNEWKYVKECLDTGWVSMAGAYVDKFEEAVAKFAGAKCGVAAVNGTCALHVALRLAGVESGDLVIVPNLTFIASVNAVKYQHADPLLLDVDPHSWQMDLNLLEGFLEENTFYDNDELHLVSNKKRIKAILPVHVLGNMCDMGQLMRIAGKFHLKVVEDASESLGSRFKGRHSGTFGDLGVFSFNGNKIITTGGGGVIVTDDEALAKQAKHLTTQAKIRPDEYIHDEIGYNYRLVNVLAAIGLAQMEQLADFVKKKKSIDAYYREKLTGVGDITFQKVEEDVDANRWLFTFQTKRGKELLQYLNRNNVQSRPFWMPMNRLPMFKNELYVYQKDHSASIYENCVSIPSSVGLSEKQLARVVEVIKEFF